MVLVRGERVEVPPGAWNAMVRSGATRWDVLVNGARTLREVVVQLLGHLGGIEGRSLRFHPRLGQRRPRSVPDDVENCTQLENRPRPPPPTNASCADNPEMNRFRALRATPRQLRQPAVDPPRNLPSSTAAARPKTRRTPWRRRRAHRRGSTGKSLPSNSLMRSIRVLYALGVGSEPPGRRATGAAGVGGLLFRLEDALQCRPCIGRPRRRAARGSAPAASMAKTSAGPSRSPAGCRPSPPGAANRASAFAAARRDAAAASNSPTRVPAARLDLDEIDAGKLTFVRQGFFDLVDGAHHVPCGSPAAPCRGSLFKVIASASKWPRPSASGASPSCWMSSPTIVAGLVQRTCEGWRRAHCGSPVFARIGPDVARRRSPRAARPTAATNARDRPR